MTEDSGKGTGRPWQAPMLVDPNGVFEAIVNGLSKLPSAIIAAALLAGPTAIWLIARFTNPPDPAKHEVVAQENLLWVCGACRSLNEDRLESCYRCHRLREAIPPALDAGRASRRAPGVGVAVGPGRPAERHPAYSWLGEEPAAASHPAGDHGEPDERVEPAAAVAQEGSVAEDESADGFVPMVLEPWVKVSGRPTPAQPTGRPRKAKAQGEAAAKPKRKPRSRAS
jgi:hypothetical protein